MSDQISELKVMRSNAGYYLGHSQDGMPYSRESGYFPTEELAKAFLDYSELADDLADGELGYLVNGEADITPGY